MSIYFRKTLSKRSFLTSSWGDPFYSSFNKRWIFAMTAGTSPTEWIAHITVSSPAMHPTTPGTSKLSIAAATAIAIPEIVFITNKFSA